jgi:hypothetical protein
MKQTHEQLFEILLGDSFNHAREINKTFGELDRVCWPGARLNLLENGVGS